MHEQRRVLITAGGTGGHVFPALAVAEQLRDEGFEVIWLGTSKGLEAKVVPAAGFPLLHIDVIGVRGKGLLNALVAPFKLVTAIFKVVGFIRAEKPDCVLGMGGFVSAAGGLAAAITRVPLVLQEQNSVAGTTNRLLAPLARQIFTGFPNVFASRASAVYSGNPLRSSFEDLALPEQRLQGDSEECRLLVLGGSQGAAILNSWMPQICESLGRELGAQHCRLVVRHQTGKVQLQEVSGSYREQGVDATVEAFIEDMPAAYCWADLVLARSGALTVTELTAVGVASVLVPFPAATDDHQSCNADFLVAAGAARKLVQATTQPGDVLATLGELLGNRTLLRRMASNARRLAMPNATRDIATACGGIAHAG